MIIKEKTSLDQLQLPGDFIKVAVDVKRNMLAAGCDFHIDCAEELMEDGSSGFDLWGANIYPKEKKIDFTSLINIRPKDNNRSIEIVIPAIRQSVEKIVKDLLIWE